MKWERPKSKETQLWCRIAEAVLLKHHRNIVLLDIVGIQLQYFQRYSFNSCFIQSLFSIMLNNMVHNAVHRICHWGMTITNQHIAFSLIKKFSFLREKNEIFFSAHERPIHFHSIKIMCFYLAWEAVWCIECVQYQFYQIMQCANST